VDSGDTHEVPPDPATVVERVRRGGGGVVLMHDFDREDATASERAGFVLQTTERLLDCAAKEGLRTCRMSDLPRQEGRS
jgi:hypothetical protein